MRTVKAGEVRKGMRVEVTREFGNQGRVSAAGAVIEREEVDGGVYLTFDHGFELDVSLDHPVTVLAEPEPEWVEGAWCRVVVAGLQRVARRVPGGWTYAEGSDYAVWSDDVTVLGRVLIVDWPGDDVARTLSKWPDGTAPLRDLDKAVEKVADAIRTQGGAR